MSDLEFEIAPRRKQPITFRLGGQILLEPAVGVPGDEDYAAEVRGVDENEYVFIPPKNAVMLMPIFESTGDTGIQMTKATFDWLGEGLSEEDNARIIGRLKDKNDDLDSDTLGNIVQGLSEKVSGRPTT